MISLTRGSGLCGMHVHVMHYHQTDMACCHKGTVHKPRRSFGLLCVDVWEYCVWERITPHTRQERVRIHKYLCVLRVLTRVCGSISEASETLCVAFSE